MKQKITVVMVFGTFDLLHPGHLDFLKQAKALGDYLVVSVARDANVKKIKGSRPAMDENARLDLVAALKFVDKAVLGDMTNPIKHIKKINPNVVALGYDQNIYIADSEEECSDYLRQYGVIAKVIRLKPFWEKKYKSKVFKTKIRSVKTN